METTVGANASRARGNLGKMLVMAHSEAACRVESSPIADKFRHGKLFQQFLAFEQSSATLSPHWQGTRVGLVISA
jgi:hypothetical protein